PILTLARTAKLVSNEKTYSLRVPEYGGSEHSGDEMGVLIQGFNQMLGQIEERDQKLLSHGQHLEEKVAARTAQLRASEAHMRTIIDTSPSAIYVISQNGLIKETNPAGSAFLEAVESRHAVGRSIYEFILPDYHSNFRELLARSRGNQES